MRCFFSQISRLVLSFKTRNLNVEKSMAHCIARVRKIECHSNHDPRRLVHAAPAVQNVLAASAIPGQVLPAHYRQRFPDKQMSRIKKKATSKSAHAFGTLREDSPNYHVNGKEASPTFRFIDLFCGIGGFRFAFERAGCKCVFSSDWNERAQITYEANFGEKPHGDIHTVAVADIPEHNILCAGFPCQPFSIAGVSKKLSLGKAHGFDDKEQANLFFSLAEIIEFHQPAAFVLENVKNLKSHDGGRTFQ